MPYAGPASKTWVMRTAFVQPLHPGLDQRQSRNVSEAELIQSLGLAARDVARGRAARGICIFVMANQRLPVFVAGALDRFPYLLTGEGHPVPYSAR